MSDSPRPHARHFDSAERQALAAGLGMWLFLGSEVLFFGALFALYAGLRSGFPEAFRRAVADNTIYLGSLNTVVLLTSSFAVALAVHELHRDHRRSAAALTLATSLFGVVFLIVKVHEYRLHFHDGIFPGGSGRWFVDHPMAGSAEFWNMYYVMTGLHAIHVTVGVGVLGIMALWIWRRRIVRGSPQMLENGALYWHLVDIVWLFLWPLFYLVRG